MCVFGSININHLNGQAMMKVQLHYIFELLMFIFFSFIRIHSHNIMSFFSNLDTLHCSLFLMYSDERLIWFLFTDMLTLNNNYIYPFLTSLWYVLMNIICMVRFSYLSFTECCSILLTFNYHLSWLNFCNLLRFLFYK